MSWFRNAFDSLIAASFPHNNINASNKGKINFSYVTRYKWKLTQVQYIFGFCVGNSFNHSISLRLLATANGQEERPRACPHAAHCACLGHYAKYIKFGEPWISSPALIFRARKASLALLWWKHQTALGTAGAGGPINNVTRHACDIVGMCRRNLI